MDDTRTHANQITQQDLADIFCAALEGGISYWARGIDVAEYPAGAEYGSDVPALGGSVVLRYDDPSKDEGNGEGRFTVDAKGLRRGIRKAAEKRGLTVERFMENHDAEDADMAVQFMVFGELVYG